jgi:hypothetical protein
VDEPIAWWNKDESSLSFKKLRGDWQPLYTAPPQKEWVGLTGEELQEIYQGAGTVHFKFAMVEAKLKEKNNG